MMINLIRNELYKLFRTKKLYVFAAVILVVLVLNLNGYEPGSERTIWTFTHGQSAPLAMIQIFAQFMVIFIPIWIGDSMANEYRQGTLKLSLLRPVTRSQLLGAKAAALLVWIGVMVIFFIAASYGIGAYYLGWGDGLEYAGQFYEPMEGIRLTIAAYALYIFPYMAYGLLVFSIAVFSGNMSLTILSSLVLMMVGLNANGLEAVAPYSLAYPMMHFHEYFVPAPDWGPALRSIGMIGVYAGVFAWLSFYAFRKKEIVY